MKKPRTSLEYQRGVDEFIERVVQNVGVGNRIYCPYLRYCNKSLYPVREVKGQLFFNGIITSYRRWTWHVEGASSSVSVNFNGATLGFRIDYNDDDVDDMVNIEEKLMDWHEQFEKLLGNADKPLYFGCTNCLR